MPATLKLDLTDAVAEYREFALEKDCLDDPGCYWVTTPQEDNPLGVDINFDLDEDDQRYKAWVYPNRVNKNGQLETDTGILLAVIDAEHWAETVHQVECPRI